MAEGTGAKKRVLVFATCVGQQLYEFLAEIPEFHSAHNCTISANYELCNFAAEQRDARMEELKALARECDVFIYQPTTEPVTSNAWHLLLTLLKPQTQTIRIPNVHISCLFPMSPLTQRQDTLLVHAHMDKGIDKAGMLEMYAANEIDWEFDKRFAANTSKLAAAGQYHRTFRSLISSRPTFASTNYFLSFDHIAPVLTAHINNHVLVKLNLASAQRSPFSFSTRKDTFFASLQLS